MELLNNQIHNIGEFKSNTSHYSFSRLILFVVPIVFYFYCQNFNVLGQEKLSPTNSQSIQTYNRFFTDINRRLYLLFDDGLFYKNNKRGDIWNEIKNHKFNNIRYAVADPHNSNILYVIAPNKHLVQKSMDSGKKWITITNGLKGSVNCLFVNPHNTDEIYVGGKNGLFKTSDGGFNWVLTNLKFNTYQILIHPNDSSLYYALTSKGFYVSKNAGVDWKLNTRRAIPN